MTALRPFHHQRPLLFCALCYGAGIALARCLPFFPLLCGIGIALGIGLMFSLSRRVTGCAVCLFFIGLMYTGAVLRPVLPLTGECTVEGTAACDFVLREDDTVAGYLENVTLTSAETSAHIDRVYWTFDTYGEEAAVLPAEGELVRFGGRVYAPSGQSNPYGFDFRMYLLQKNTTCGVTGCKEPLILSHPGRGLRSFFYGVRKALTARLEDLFGDKAALPEALLLGVKDDLPDEMQEAFTSAGLAHLLAVSGLHVGLIMAALYYLLLRRLPVRFRFYAAALFLLFYCALLDFAAPVVRASVLILVTQLRLKQRRASDPVTALSAAFLLILFVSPLSLFSAGFQLSFAAVLGIELYLPLLRRAFRVRPGNTLAEGLLVVFPATVATFIPTVQWFHRVSLLGPLINPFACMLFSVLLPVYAIVLLIGCVLPPLGQILAVPVNLATGLIESTVRFAGSLSFASVRLPSIPPLFIPALVLLMLSFTRLTAFQRRTKVIAITLSFVLAFSVSFFTRNTAVRYIQLAMGQADSAVIEDGHETVVIDTGDSSGDLCSYLLASGRDIDTLVITHLHSDHCGGVKRLADNGIRIGTVLLPLGAEEMDIDEGGVETMAFLREQGIPFRFVRAGDTVSTARTQITVLWPDAVVPGQDPNYYSLALLCELDGVTLLNAGDMDGLFEMYAAHPADILKAAHHGSAASSSEAFLASVSPSLALITANGFSQTLPAPDTLARMDARQIPVMNTGLTGAITVCCDGTQAVVTQYLPHYPD